MNFFFLNPKKRWYTVFDKLLAIVNLNRECKYALKDRSEDLSTLKVIPFSLLPCR